MNMNQTANLESSAQASNTDVLSDVWFKIKG